jgi:hypothetical protein
VRGLFPVYKATFERGDGSTNGWPNTSSADRDHVIAWSKDLGRSIHYFETRPEIDHNKRVYGDIAGELPWLLSSPQLKTASRRWS